MPGSNRLTLDNPAVYAIRIQRHLDDKCSDYIGGATICVQSQPDGSSVSAVTGDFQDQAALTGTLNLLYDLGMPLLSVECISFEPNNPVRLATINTSTGYYNRNRIPGDSSTAAPAAWWAAYSTFHSGGTRK